MPLWSRWFICAESALASPAIRFRIAFCPDRRGLERFLAAPFEFSFDAMRMTYNAPER
jgi:hypothetical protein